MKVDPPCNGGDTVAEWRLPFGTSWESASVIATLWLRSNDNRICTQETSVRKLAWGNDILTYSLMYRKIGYCHLVIGVGAS